MTVLFVWSALVVPCAPLSTVKTPESIELTLTISLSNLIKSPTLKKFSAEPP